MSRIIITSAGTTGDFVPFMALGRRLQSRGHRVVMAVNPAMIPLAGRAGLEAVAVGRLFGAEQARSDAATFEEGSAGPSDGIARKLRDLDLGRTYRDLLAAIDGADLLLSSSLQGVASWVREATGIPWINATIFAMEFPHSDEPPPPSTDAGLAHWRPIFDYRNAVREEVGLPPLPDDAWPDRYWSDRLVLVASSEHFSRPNLALRPQARLTGFWFDPPTPEAWTPDPALAAFLDAGPPPLVLTLSSLPVTDPARVVTLHAEAASLLGARMIVQQGWAGLSRSNLPASAAIREEDIHFAGHVPHDWLFPRCSAILHHGGIGTTAQALRCRRPMLVEPYCNDQFFNAARVSDLGVGAAVDHRLLTPANLADALAAHVLVPDVRDRVEMLGYRVASEDGLAVACDLIESHI